MNVARQILTSGSQAGGDRTALVGSHGRWTYSQLADRSGRAAGVLGERGVRSGDRVAIIMENCPEQLATFFGCATIGAVATTVNQDFRADELGYIVEHAQPAAVVLDEAGARAFSTAGIDPDCPILMVGAGGTTPRLGSSFDQALAEATPPPFADVDSSHPVLITYTSGATARPKAVLSSHGAESWAVAAHRGIWRINALDTVAVPLPLSWVYGLATVTLTFLSAAAKVVLLPRFYPDSLARAIDAERVSHFFGVTAMFALLARYAEERGGLPDLTNIRFALSGGERRNEDAFEWFRSASGAAVFDAYAMSEARPVFTYDPLIDTGPRPGSCGIVVPGVEVKLVDREGAPVPPGAAGELWVRSPGMMTEYFRQPEYTADRVNADGWFRTGDLLHEDDDGYWYFLGRSTDMIRRGGVNVSPVEVQNVLLRHPDVSDVAISAVPDELYGEAVGALVVGRFASSEDALVQLRAFALGTLADFKIPTVVRYVRTIPRTPTGKLDHRTIREMLASGPADGA